MKRIKVEVTQRHIDRGIPESVYSCPIALAVHSALVEIGDKRTVKIWFGQARFIPDLADPWAGDSVLLPKKCDTFVGNFDAGRRVEPFSFMLKVPE